MTGAVLVFLGGGIGAVLRHGANRLGMMLFGTGFPVATLAVNVVGSLLMGMLAANLAEGPAASQQLRLFLTTGVLGGFTTFSAFSLDALTLWQRGQPGLAAAYVAGSVFLSLAAVGAGFVLGRAL
ncbi:fluoride efflux transporter CrcB [Sphingomonas astaxanthinifaciens]|uniref:Fluoride-specific ion channel FluC n=1 Tax=Sphingomonas astaxanthinifaciens DSM 22298 TaxID=1123267 RepID=A0ABQ5Z7E9_9SPHN|nr:fluoride efflux transporter CrcB [Sphingomonas astaxanthinifaciens]GLR47897.1 putative fluoride ion transporter CrcB [Sphingomonas astaxanthinifaciens DSM 22298]